MPSSTAMFLHGRPVLAKHTQTVLSPVAVARNVKVVVVVVVVALVVLLVETAGAGAGAGAVEAVAVGKGSCEVVGVIVRAGTSPGPS